MNVRRELAAVAAVWRSVEQEYRRAGNPRLMLGLLALLVVALPLLQAWRGGEIGFAAKLALAAAVLLLCIVAWFGLCINIMRQNHPQLARLVPGQVRTLRRSLWLGATLIITLITLSAAMVSLGNTPRHWQAPVWVFGVVVIATAIFLAWLALLLRWPWLTISFFVMPLTGVLGPQFEWLVAAYVEGGPVIWVAVAGLALALATVGMWAVVMSGGPRHEACHRRVPNMAMKKGQGNLAQQWGISNVRLLDGLSGQSLFRVWLRRVGTGASNSKHRLAWGLPPGLHPLGILAACWPSTVMTLGLLLVLDLLPQGSMSTAMHNPMLVVIMGASLVFAHFMRIEWTLRNTAGEQALLRLLPGTPHGSDLNHWLARWLAAGAAVLLLWAGLLLVFCLTWLHEIDSDWAWAALFSWLCGLAQLPGLWQNWARVEPMRQQAATSQRWPLLAALVMIVATAVALQWPQLLPLLDTLVLVAGALWGLRRWRALSQAPVAWPVGHALRRGDKRGVRLGA
jgi:hypothetical protein